jgi:hypothetical protein
MNILKVLVIGPLCGLFFCLPAQAQKTKAQLNTEITTTFPDNTVGQITPTGLRLVSSDIANSIMPTAPVVAGNLACFNGTTGLLQDCGSAPATVPLAIGVTPIGNGATTRVIYDNAGILGEYLISGTGNVCMTTSCAMATPNLGTPSAATLTNAIGLPVSTGISGLGTGIATALGVNVGSVGAPIVNGGALGTPSSGTGTNLTGLPISSGVSGLGTSVAATLANNLNATGGLISPTPTRAGDIIYWNNSNWVALAGNNSGTLTLQENASGVPVWASVAGTGTVTSAVIASGAGISVSGTCTITTSGTCTVAATNEAFLETLTAASSTTLSSAVSWSGYNSIRFVFRNVLPATAGVNFLMNVNSAGVQNATYLNSTFSSSAGGALAFGTASSGILLNGGNSLGNTNPGSSGSVTLTNIASTTQKKAVSGTMTGVSNAAQTANVAVIGGWWDGGNGAVTGAQFSMSSGAMTSGFIDIYGLK